MFKFEFEVDEERDNPFLKTKTTGAVIDENLQEQTLGIWYSSTQIPLNENMQDIDFRELNANGKIIRYTTGLRLKSDLGMAPDIEKAEESHSDLLPGIYEGGAKIWECTYDVLKCLNDDHLFGKSVLDLGCGIGLLGFYAYKCGADTVHFQDYNKDVLERITMPNLFLNIHTSPNEHNMDIVKLGEKVKFYSGDWESYANLSAADRFDVILTSETIYNPKNHLKLLNCFDLKLKQDGVIYVAAKTYYFGVGGGLRSFENLIKADSRFTAQVIWMAEYKGVPREILELKRYSNK